jgi:shikimate dehydrogenase
MPSIQPVVAAAPSVRGSTELIFTVANPIAQVMAPQALNLIFSSFDMDAVSVPIRIEDHQFEPFMTSALAAGNVRGMLVSIPHKTRLMKLLNKADAAAARSGAANAVRRNADGIVEGALLDGSGFLGALHHHGVEVAGRRVLLLGAGGAGLAIGCALAACQAGPAEVAVFDADADRAGRLVGLLETHSPLRTHAQVASSNDPAGFDLVINATPLGLHTTDPLPLDPLRLEGGATVFDILMKSQPTPVERACQERGIRIFPGHEMMVQQIPDYLDFFGFGATATELRQAGHPVMAAVRHTIAGPHRAT